ncbi:serine/threonine-protein kinase, partial [Actinoplanes sp. NPDC051633]|uniref:serine/threonine-protein kinase n=1 Tax=Actinoplanes sp. NPDC051633 TaxID=3155670 RepID=UPI00341E4F69
MVAGGLLVAGRYRVGRRLAAGGLSHVWLATDESDGSTVAIKRCTLPPGLSPHEGELVGGLSLREARAFAEVDHPNVVHIRDVVPDAGEPWIVMDYVPSRSLQEVVSSSGAMHPRRVAEIGLQILQGLVAVFDAGLLHLDVKPGNVLIGDDGRVLLSDFGPAVTELGVRALTEAGIVLGSLHYVAPERLFDGISTQRADLWSFGATLYFAVEGRRPFRRENKDETMAALKGRTPDPLLRAGPLTDVICGLMRADPEDRLSAAAAERMLRRIAGAGVRVLPSAATSATS